MKPSRSLPWAALAVVVAAAALGAGCGGPRIGLVDSQRILTESVLALSFQRELDDREKTMAADLRILAGQLKPEDLDARRQTYLRELEVVKRELEGRLNERIRKAVTDVARRRRLRIVFVKDATSFGGIDVTQEVIDQLK